MGHETGDHEMLAAGRGQRVVEAGRGEGVGQALVDDRLAGLGRDRVDDREVQPLGVEQTARPAACYEFLRMVLL